MMPVQQINPPDTFASVTHKDPIAFFETVYQTFQEAEHNMGGALERFYRITNYTIRLRFAGPALLFWGTSSLEHLATEPVPNPDLTICLWDDDSTGTTLPSPPWLGYGSYDAQGGWQGVYTRRGDIRGYNNDRIQVAFHMGADVLTMLDTEQNRAIYWTRRATSLPAYEARSPLRTVLHWWLRQYGLQYVHAGAVGTTQGGVLLAGKSGSGKSTTALTCLNSGLLYASDDYCLIAADPTPYVYCLYNSAKVNADNIHRVPHLDPAFKNSDPNEIEKATFFIHQHYPEKLVSGLPVRAILLPRVTGRVETTLTSAPSTAGLSGLALSTMAQLAGAGPATLQMLKQFVDQVSCYHLNLGTDLAQIPDVIRTLLSKS